MKKLVACLFFALYGCANSASHEVVTTSKMTDESLSCTSIQSEKRRLMGIVDGVHQDKKDMTGADLVDGILWFPFNVIAKQANYAAAVSAARKRYDHLSVIESEMDCANTKTRRASKYDKPSLTRAFTQDVKPGRGYISAEKISMAMECGRDLDILKNDAEKEIYQTNCSGGQMLIITCEWGNCKVLK